LDTSPLWIGLCVIPFRPMTKLSRASEPVSDMWAESCRSIDMVSGRRFGFFSGIPAPPLPQARAPRRLQRWKTTRSLKVARGGRD
jgi:hypothetical protein